MLTCRAQGYDELWVTQLVPGHPAERCGVIMVHDVLCKVDGVSVLGWSLDAVCNKIKGQEGTSLCLEFRRDKDKYYEVTLCRGGEELWKLPKTQTPRGFSPPPAQERGRGGSQPPEFRHQSSVISDLFGNANSLYEV